MTGHKHNCNVEITFPTEVTLSGAIDTETHWDKIFIDDEGTEKIFSGKKPIKNVVTKWFKYTSDHSYGEADEFNFFFSCGIADWYVMVGAIPGYWSSGRIKQYAKAELPKARKDCKNDPKCGGIFAPSTTWNVNSGKYYNDYVYTMKLDSSGSFCPSVGHHSNNKYHILKNKRNG